jgi:heme/copper-type cytochrome/quinol oxidase subunit 2|tara:strand:- start:331 stop:474 length:144 start_codon:yes stop_codon:yes gene_type:complete
MDIAHGILLFILGQILTLTAGLIVYFVVRYNINKQKKEKENKPFYEI